jgi:hypothetical protein
VAAVLGCGAAPLAAAGCALAPEVVLGVVLVFVVAPELVLVSGAALGALAVPCAGAVEPPSPR